MCHFVCKVYFQKTAILRRKKHATKHKTKNKKGDKKATKQKKKSLKNTKLAAGPNIATPFKATPTIPPSQIKSVVVSAKHGYAIFLLFLCVCVCVCVFYFYGIALSCNKNTDD